jgi:hypothetical protein
VRQQIAVAERHRAPFFGVHRTAIETMPPECASLIADFWVRRHLVESEEAALNAMQRLKAVLQ